MSFGLVTGLAGCASTFSTDNLVECAAAGELVYLEDLGNENRLNEKGIYPRPNILAHNAARSAQIARLRLHDRDQVSYDDPRLKLLNFPEVNPDIQAKISDSIEKLRASPRANINGINRRCNRLVKQAIAEAE